MLQRQDADWRGVEDDTRAFVRKMARERRLTGVHATLSRDWFKTLIDAGLPTDLNVDFDSQPMTAHLESAIRASGYTAAEKRRLRDIEGLRNALYVYALAFDEGVRTRPVPGIALRHLRGFATPHATILAQLPAADQRRLEAGDTILRTLGRLQWEQRGAQGLTRGADGKLHHATLAPSTAQGECETMRSFLQHAHRKGWIPFDFDHLLTPERICDFVFYGQNCDGGPRATGSSAKLAFRLRDYLYRTRIHSEPVLFVTEEQLAAIDARIKFEMTRPHLHNVRAASESNKGRYKWFPTLEQVRLAIEALEDMIVRADAQRSAGAITYLHHWRLVRDATIGLFALFTMARIDSVSTISLSHIRRDPVTGAILRYGGSAIVADIVRAKTKNRQFFPFAPEFILPANVLVYVAKLLAIEGRSLDNPLRPGERAVRLTVGDQWGGTVIPSGAFEVVPLFRAEPNSPAPLCYERVRRVLQELLTDLHFGATNAHTFRATGAIYWTFVRGMPEEFVMQLGLWTSPGELRQSYAKIRNADRLRLIAKYLPVDAGSIPEKAKGEREQAAADGIAALTRILARPNDAAYTEGELEEVRRCAERIEQGIAAERGQKWSPTIPNPFRTGEIARVNELLISKGIPGGISEALGRAFLAEDKLREHAIGVMRAATALPPKVKYLKTTLATRMPIQPRGLKKAN